MTTDKNELLACPFCGSERVKMMGGGLSQEAETVWCTNCHANHSPKWWNQRRLVGYLRPSKADPTNA